MTAAEAEATPEAAAPPPASAEVEEKVRALAVEDWPQGRAALAAAVAWEDKAPDLQRSLGWELAEVGTGYPVVRRLLEGGVVRQAYHSRSFRNYLLIDREATRRGLQPRPAALTVATPEAVAEYEALAASGEAFERLLGFVAPQVHGLVDAKRAVLLVLASLDDAGESRARINGLLHGPPGTAKTVLAAWAASVAGVEVFGSRTTGPGLTAHLGTGEPGLLPKLHRTEFRLAVVDEAEKVPPEAIRHTLQALEEGAFTVTSANGIRKYQAEVRFLGTANETDGLPRAFVDRMDFLVHVPLPSQDAARRIVAQITRDFMRPGQERQEDFVRGYLRWCRAHRPDFNDAERDIVGHVLGALVELKGKAEVPIRPFESILRVAYALARLERGDVTADTVLRAVDVLHPDLGEAKLGLLRLKVESLRKRAGSGA